MLLSLNNVFNNEGETLSINCSVSLQEEGLCAVSPFVTPVSVIGSVANRVGIVTLSAKVRFPYQGVCDRCAEPFTRDFRFDLEHTLVRQLNNGENDDYLVVENGVLDLDELVRTDILLALPSKMLCKEDCQGLCSVCGQNQNQNRCNCKKPIDPRLAALAQLLEE